MSRPDRRRRRAHRSIVLVLVGGGALLAVLIGGALRIGGASGPYWQSIDRSYAAQGRVLVDQSNRAKVQLSRVLGAMASQSRRQVQAELDLLVRATGETAQAAAALEPPAPWGGLGSEFAGAMADRSRAVARLRSTVEGLLGMSPPSGGTGGAASSGSQPSSAISALSRGAAARALGDVGRLLERADRSYAAVRRAFRHAPGAPRLPVSTWVTDPGAWASGPVATVVDRLLRSPTLAPVRQVVLLTDAVSVTPPAVPQPPQAPGATSLLGPTRSVTVTAVVANQGNVAERHLELTASVRPLAGGAEVRRSTTVSLSPGRSVAVRLPPLPVVPGHSYDLTVSVTPPAGQAPGGATSQTYALEVAPTGTTTTTTTTRPPGAHGATSPST